MCASRKTNTPSYIPTAFCGHTEVAFIQLSTDKSSKSELQDFNLYDHLLLYYSLLGDHMWRTFLQNDVMQRQVGVLEEV